MGQELAIQDGAVALTTSMTLPVISALADSGGEWSREHAIRVLNREGLEPAALLAQLTEGTKPVATEWLAERLKVLWKSSTPSGSLDAKAWLHETGRLLMDLPGDIVSRAIDEAVMGSLRGFMPTVGEIRAIAVPRFEERKRQAARMRAVVHGDLGRPRYPWEPVEREIAEEDLCTPEEAAEILRTLKVGTSA